MAMGLNQGSQPSRLVRRPEVDSFIAAGITHDGLAFELLTTGQSN
jgi:hypothetical protein